MFHIDLQDRLDFFETQPREALLEEILETVCQKEERRLSLFIKERMAHLTSEIESIKLMHAKMGHLRSYHPLESKIARDQEMRACLDKISQIETAFSEAMVGMNAQIIRKQQELVASRERFKELGKQVAYVKELDSKT